jgi:hypothetical protein
MRRSELSTPMAIWILLLAELGRPPRKRVRLPREEKLGHVPVWLWGPTVIFLATLGLTVWGYEHGWGYQSHPYHEYMRLPMGACAVVGGVLLIAVGWIVVVGRRENRRKLATWPETLALRQRDRIHHLEAELDMREYDEISAITHLQRQLPPPPGSYYEAQGRPRREEVPHETIADRRRFGAEQAMARLRFRVDPNLTPFENYERALAIGYNDAARKIAAEAGVVDPSRWENWKSEPVVVDAQPFLMAQDHAEPWGRGCTCHICEEVRAYLARHERKRQARSET